MQTKHTPAPWSVDRHSDTNDIIIRVDGNIIANCSIDFEDHLNNEDKIEANAKLIAAAPELLEALKMALELLEANKYESHWYTLGHFRKMNQAYNKATL